MTDSLARMEPPTPTARSNQMFPMLTPAQTARVAVHGIRRREAPFEVGAADVPSFFDRDRIRTLDTWPVRGGP